ncbi:MAG: AmmeMemoRadiSam system protein A [Spirochaetales bacterium]|nr:AmmeMemoRadiSam system protein A [Spirochaetales bacterium]
MYLPQSIQVRLAMNTIWESLDKEALFHGFDELKEVRAACFVSLHSEREGQEVLRGCIGTLTPVKENLYEEIRSNSLSAAYHDPRFSPLTRSELDHLIISVDVLEPSEPIDSPDLLDPAVYGVIVETDYRRGVLLPDLDGVDSVERQLEIARMKGGIRPEEAVNLHRFRVKRYY